MGNPFLTAFLKSWGVILASEIGDKTFFIAAIMAMRMIMRQVGDSKNLIHDHTSKSVLSSNTLYSSPPPPYRSLPVQLVPWPQ